MARSFYADGSMMNHEAICRGIVVVFLGWSLLLSGCEDVDVMLATEAGVDAVKAVTLSDAAVRDLAAQAAVFADGEHRVAPPESPYARRLARLAAGRLEQDGYRFDCRVYLAPEINAFAMADGSIRVYSGLMDLMSDAELLFILGHEMGHVVKEHVRQKLRVAYASRAVRKGVASLNNEAGALAGSALGGFAELLLNAQFSQQEERAADDYGLAFLEKTGADTGAAVSALQKLAALGNNHSFLSSHPAPDKRAERLAARLTAPGKDELAGSAEQPGTRRRMEQGLEAARNLGSRAARAVKDLAATLGRPEPPGRLAEEASRP